jgi:hypothetical protein
VFREEKDITRQKGFLTADVEFVDYRSNKFTSPDPINSADSYFDGLNRTINDIYRATFNARVGGELKFETIMFRLGFGYFGSPYKDVDFKAGKVNLSGGLGYRNKGKFIDLAYVHQIYNDGYFPYRLEQGFYAPALLRNNNGTVLLTVGFKF